MRAFRLTLLALSLLSSSLVAQVDTLRLRPARLSFHVKHDSTGVLLVSWDKNTESDLAGYRVYEKDGAGLFGQVSDVNVRTETPSWVSRDLIVNRRYFYAVTAYDFTGNESGLSEQDSAVARRPVEIIPPGVLEISNLNRYREFLFTAGASVYSDRPYLIVDARELEGAQGIRTANGDKQTPVTAEWVVFDVSEAADVIISYDTSLTPPSWLSSSFSRAGFSVLTETCGELEAWISRFPAGRVQLGANEAPTNLSCMYLIAVRGAQ